MAAKGKTLASDSAASGKKSLSRSQKAGLQFPIGRIARFLRNRKYAQHIGTEATVFLAAVLEYLATEVLEIAGNVARDNKRLRIIPRHIQLTVRHDEELNTLLDDVTICSSGVIPKNHNNLLRIQNVC
ncbi:putative histone H2A.2 [Capsicum annuum]|uniref:histone H2A-beta, sperm n=1 Tax=Capsicum annuum TaxID=4072 RepID=UPI0007BF2304|nr:histone H2A-beta, sperm [Capsicum annuum]KAF3627271.1 putative histone H2A.2 [Capsicum annuum]KAF3681042.1 putative histone H2A.2 [Capsicum annuum]